MLCPKCGQSESDVIDTRGDGESVRRRRECQGCHYRFTTYERIEHRYPMVIKRDGRREPFEREKIRTGLRKACEKTSVGTDEIDSTVEVIEKRVLDLCVKEVSSAELGDLLMESLKLLNMIAYVRFASVYREFSDVQQFVETVESLTKVKKR